GCLRLFPPTGPSAPSSHHSRRRPGSVRRRETEAVRGSQGSCRSLAESPSPRALLNRWGRAKCPAPTQPVLVVAAAAAAAAASSTSVITFAADRLQRVHLA